MPGRLLTKLIVARSGVAAAEMALVTPLLTVLMFTTFETGNYFYSQHVVVTAVRDGARYASRLPFSQVQCNNAPNRPALTQIEDITRTGAISGGVQRLAGWTSATGTITVTYSCGTTDLPGPDKGIYTGLSGVSGGVPVVTVIATVPYKSLFSQVGLVNSTTLNLSAQSQIPVMGI